MNFFNLQYGPFFSVPRQLIKAITSAIFPIVIKIWRFPEVATIEDTIQKLINERLSIIRFGDGEILYLVDKRSLPFQSYENLLAEKLKEILVSEYPNVLVGLPDAYRVYSDEKVSTFWRSQITWNYPRFQKLLNLKKRYYNASITRLYYGTLDLERTKYLFNKIREIWKDRRVLIIEGEKSRFGIGNDLLRNTITVERILGPYHNAFQKHNEIIKEAMKQDRDKLILVAMGPAAKAITYDLALAGFQAIDIGNLDIEYEWFLRGVKERIAIPGKYTSEAKGGRVVQDLSDSLYETQIVARHL